MLLAYLERQIIGWILNSALSLHVPGAHIRPEYFTDWVMELGLLIVLSRGRSVETCGAIHCIAVLKHALSAKRRWLMHTIYCYLGSLSWLRGVLLACYH